MIEDEDGCFTFSDEDFERRYSSEDGGSSAPGPSPTTQQPKPFVAQVVRSRNRYMRTLRRRLLSSGLQIKGA